VAEFHVGYWLQVNAGQKLGPKSAIPGLWLQDDLTNVSNVDEVVIASMFSTNLFLSLNSWQ